LEKPRITRKKIRLVSYVVSLVAVLGIYSASGISESARLQREINASSQRSLAQLEDCISAIHTDLVKGLYVNSPNMLDIMVQELSKDASGAKIALSSLPVSDAHLDNTYKFLSQVASFVNSLGKSLSSGRGITGEQRATLGKLISVAKTLLDDISSVIESVESGETTFTGSASTLAAADSEIMQLSDAFDSAEQDIGDYPTLIYDGPFSDHIFAKNSVMLENSAEITKEKAHEIAAEFTGISASELLFAGEMEGNIACYLFSNNSISVAVSKKGGYVVYIIGSSFAGEEKFTAGQALENAYEFLEKRGIYYMTDSYYSVNDGICTVNFAYSEYGITCYPDLIKVSISLETGNVVSYDASGFIMNHKPREYKEPEISAENAVQNLSPLLEVISLKRAIIPTDYATEQDTYEFHCKNSEGQEFLVYIDTETAEEDNILILLYSDNGILTK